MNGYFDDFEATSMRLHRGWYDSQDMGYMDADGYLWHVGRLARFLKIGGEMVSLLSSRTSSNAPCRRAWTAWWWKRPTPRAISRRRGGDRRRR